MDRIKDAQAVDVAVESVGGCGDTLLQAQRMVRPKGRVLVLGEFSTREATTSPLLLALREVEIIGSMTYATRGGRADYQIALDVVADFGDAARTLVTHRFTLDDAHTAFETALDKSTRSIKVHLNPNG